LDTTVGAAAAVAAAVAGGVADEFAVISAASAV